MGRIRQDWGLYKRTYTISGKKKIVWWYYIYAPDGSRHRASTGQTTKQEAHNFVQELTMRGEALPIAVRQEVFGPLVGEFGRSIWSWDGDYIQAKLLRGRITPGYVQSMASRFVQHIVPILGTRPIRSVTIAELEALFRNLTRESELAPKTVNHIFSSAKAVWDEAFRLEVIDKNPFHKMTMLESRTQERGQLSTIDALQLLHRRWWRDDVVWAINLCAAATGARVAELCALTIGSVMKDRIWIGASVRSIEGVVQDTKTGDKGKRWAAIPTPVYLALKRVMGDRKPGEFVFRNELGTSNQYGSYKVLTSAHLGLEIPVKQLKVSLDRFNADRLEKGEEAIPTVTFHGWRHFVMSLLSARCGPDAVSLHIGHAIPGVKGSYLHQTEEHIQDCLRALSEVFHDPKQFG